MHSTPRPLLGRISSRSRDIRAAVAQPSSDFGLPWKPGLWPVELHRGEAEVSDEEADAGVPWEDPYERSLRCSRPRRGRSPALRYQFKVPYYVPLEAKYTVLKVAGSLRELGEWNVRDAPVMQLRDNFSWELEALLPIKEFDFKIVASTDNIGTSVRWEAEGSGNHRSVEVVPGSDSHLLSIFSSASEPEEYTVEVICPWSDTSNTQLALAVQTVSMAAAVELLELYASMDVDSFKEELQDLVDSGQDKDPKMKGWVAALAEAAATGAGSSALSCMSQRLQQVLKSPIRVYSMPVNRVHVLPGTSMAALGRVAHASTLSIEAACAELAPRKSVREWLEDQTGHNSEGASIPEL